MYPVFLHPAASSQSQAHLLIEIENLVKDIMVMTPQITISAIRQNSHDHSQIRFDGVLYGRLLQSLPRYLDLYSPEHDYSEHLYAFWQGCFMAGLLSPDESYDLSHSLTAFWTMGQVIYLVEQILVAAQTPMFSRKAYDRRYQQRIKQQAQAVRMTNTLNRYARTLLIRIDLSILKHHQTKVDIDTFYGFLDQLLHKRDNRQGIFKDIIGSGWCIEQGVRKGYHIHFYACFNGAEHQCDWYMADEIGRHWLEITHGLGHYRNCNTSEEKAKYARMGTLGVGMIHRDDAAARQNAIYALSYLTQSKKEDQYLRMRPKGRRAYA